MDTMKEFSQNMQKLDDFFRSGRPLPESTTLEYWAELGSIPAQAFTDICRQHMRNCKPTQGNYPTINDLIALWQEWLRSHPEKQAENYIYDNCDYCEGTGGIIAYKLVDTANHGEVKYKYIFRCGYCQNWEKHFSPIIPRMKIDEIENKGYVIDYKE